MRVLSLDASTKSTGWAVFENKELKSYGCLVANSDNKFKRIISIVQGIKDIITEHDIEKIVLEEVRPEVNGKNLTVLKALMYLQAAIEFLVYQEFPKIKTEYLYPNQWRKTCGIAVGRGQTRNALKPKDIVFVKQKYNIDVNDDIADAIGIGYAYLMNNAW